MPNTSLNGSVCSKVCTDQKGLLRTKQSWHNHVRLWTSIFLAFKFRSAFASAFEFFFLPMSILLILFDFQVIANTITSTIGGKNYKQLQVKLGKPSSESSHDTWKRKYSLLLQKVRQSRCCKHFSSRPRFAGRTRIMTLSSWPGDYGKPEHHAL